MFRKSIITFAATAFSAWVTSAAAEPVNESFGRACSVEKPQTPRTIGEEMLAALAAAIEARGCARGDVIMLHGEFGYSQLVAAQFCDFTRQVLIFGHAPPVNGGSMVTCVYVGGRRATRGAR